MTADLVVVGAGISGLCLANEVLEARPGAKVVVLEGAARAGGRAHDAKFKNVLVHEGAGVGRVGKDAALAGLLQQLGLASKIGEWRAPKEPASVMRFVRELRKAARITDTRNVTFGAFARRTLKERYADFENAVGYSDFQGAAVTDTLADYGFEFLAAESFVVPWNDLVRALRRRVHDVRLNTVVTGVDSRGDGLVVVRTSRGALTAKMVVVAVPPSRALTFMRAPLLKCIGINRFLRGYAEVELATTRNVAALVAAFPTGELTAVPGYLQKVSPLEYFGTRAVMLCAYADSKRARALAGAPDLALLGSSLDPNARTAGVVSELRKLLASVLPDPFEIRASMAISACPGTHHFKQLPARFADRGAFLHAAQRPRRNVFVVGEAMSRTQGWTEGALESVQAVLGDVLKELAEA